MPKIIRLSDPVSCGDTVCEGSGNVFANGLPVTRVNVDHTCGHCFAPTVFTSGSPTVFANGAPVVRAGDPINQSIHICPGDGNHSGVAAGGSLDVLVNS